MLKVIDIEYIRKKHRDEGWSIRKLARHAEVSRQTVRKALRDAGPWRYTLTQAKPCPVMDPHREVIQGWLEEDNVAPRKQRHTAKRIYDRLCEELGFRGADSTVRRYVARLRRELGASAGEPLLLLKPEAGEMAQVDWGQAEVILQGKPCTIHLFCLRLHHSGVPFAWATWHERMEAFLEGHVRAFAWLGGVSAQVVYDNLATAVRKVLRGHERELNERFVGLRSHYLYDSLFCNRGAGREKGGVENLVGYVRRNALTPRLVVDSLAEVNARLLAWCEREKQRSARRWEEEREALRPLPPAAFRPCVEVFLPVSKLALVTYDRNRYSVPGELMGQMVRVDVFADRLEVYHGGEQVAEHVRREGRGHTSLQLAHYLRALERKPFAVMHAAVVRELPEVYQQARRQLTRANPAGYRELVRILLLHRDFGAEEVAAAVESGLMTGRLTADDVRQSLLNARRHHRQLSVGDRAVPVPRPWAEWTIPVGEPSHYNVLLEVNDT